MNIFGRIIPIDKLGHFWACMALTLATYTVHPYWMESVLIVGGIGFLYEAVGNKDKMDFVADMLGVAAACGVMLLARVL